MPKLLSVALALLLALPCLAAGPDDKPANPQTEKWYVLLLQGQRTGWMKTTEKTEGDKITSGSQMELHIKRGKAEIGVSITSDFVETRDGKPISMTTVQNLGALGGSHKTVVFKGDQMEVTTTEGDQKSVQTVPTPKGDWLTPAATERYVKEQLAKDAKEIKYRTIDPTEGTVLSVTRTVLEKNGSVEVFGRTVPAVKWSNEVDKYKEIKSTEYVSEAGETVKADTDMGFMTLTQLLADKDLALSPMDAPELLDSTVVTPSKPIYHARTLKYAVYNLSATKDDITDLPSVVGQTVTREGPNQLKVTEDAAVTEPVEGDKLKAAIAECLPPAPMVKADDPVIMKLVEEAKVGGLPAAQAAEKLRRFVHDYITQKDMSVGFASASEVARTKTGDCTEHAMLLAAMLRGAAIPSRVVSGLVYVDQFAGHHGVFGYHMWTQGLLKDKDGKSAWVNLDGTLPDATPYDATHIILSTCSLADGQMQNFMVQTAPLIGRLKIEVVETK